MTAMKLTRREFLGGAAAACLASPAWAQSEKPGLTAPHPDYDALKQVYWNRVYGIYDRLPNHVDPRPRGNTERFVRHFMDWT